MQDVTGFIFLILIIWLVCSTCSEKKIYFICDNLKTEDRNFYSSRTFSIKAGVFSKTDLIFKGKKEGFYREIFDVYHIDKKNNILTHSSVYYVSTDDYNKNFKEEVNYNNPNLFDMIKRKPKKGYKKIGWNKTSWQCFEVSYFKYLTFNLLSPLQSFFMVIGFKHRLLKTERKLFLFSNPKDK